MLVVLGPKPRERNWLVTGHGRHHEPVVKERNVVAVAVHEEDEGQRHDRRQKPDRKAEGTVSRYAVVPGIAHGSLTPKSRPPESNRTPAAINQRADTVSFRSRAR